MNFLEWARRRAGTHEPVRAIDELRSAKASDPAVAARTGFPAPWLEGVASFYDLLHGDRDLLVCAGTACAFAARAGPAPAGRAVHCLGRCHEAPADSRTSPSAIPRRSLVAEPVVLRRLLGASGSDHADDWAAEYRLLPAADILEIVTGSGLRGRGGAAFPTGAKWRIARDTPAPERYVVANGDEGDPGAFVDRLLLEEAPHSVLAGMLACARAIGAGRGVVYVRGEYPRAVERVRAAIDTARARGLTTGFHVEVVAGAGSYVAGEETALLRSIEGLRAEPSPKPPYPAERGLHGRPTVVQNVETLSVIPWILRSRRRADKKAVCVSGAVTRPGVIEIALGTPLSTVLADAGPPPSGRKAKLALVGGPMGRVVAAADFDVPLSFERLPGMGHGGIVVLDESVSARALAEHLFAFAASESCGACSPCRIGCGQLSARADARSFERLLRTLETGSLCGFGQGVPRPLRDLVRAFPREMFP